MADNLRNTSNVTTNQTGKAALVTDLNSSFVGQDQYSHARNAVRNSKEGDLGTIGNEPSNTLCFETPYKIIGTVSLPGDEIMVFSTNGGAHEIGIGNELTCEYRKILDLDCLNFSEKFPITGIAKQDFQRGVVVTFTDKYNPVRRIELKKLDEIETCDDILLFKKIDHPCINIQKGQVGSIPNGTYSVAIAYVVDNQVFSDWYAITNRVMLYSETGLNSLEIAISGLDTEFDQFALLVVGTYVDPNTKGVTKLAKQVGIYPTSVKSVSVSDFVNSTFEEIQISNLLIQKKAWLKAGIISSNANYLLLGDLVSRPEEDYQLKAMTIESEYVIEQVPAAYYEFDGADVGYYRDENYDFYIQGVYNSGELTDKFHIPGPRPTPSDLAPVSGPDVYELDKQFQDCEEKAKIPRWQVENTAAKPTPLNAEFSCGRRMYGYGRPGVFLSTELYPDNPKMFGIDAGSRIRYHKMPDECKMPRYSIIDGITYVNIIGVRFSNIPAFDNPDIVGYKITRSDRKGGNGTVIARGLMTNVRSYFDTAFNQTVMYSNYPVNDLSPDQFLSSTQTAFKNGKETNFNALTDYYTDRFSFYSPHTLFEPRYSLGQEIKIESEEIADVRGKFELVYNHPKQKLMNQFSFWLSAAVGFIETALVFAGKTTATGIDILSAKGVTAGVEYQFNKDFKINSVEDLIGLDIIGYISAQIKAGAFTSVIGTIQTILTTIASLGIKVPYSILSGIRVAEETMNMIRDFTGYTDYVYQYNAIANFNSSKCVSDGNKRRRLLTQATYIPSTVVSLDAEIFNNLFRERTVYLKLNKAISKPSTIDNSRQTASGFGICDDIDNSASSTGSAFYATSKAINPNQYGSMGSSSPVSMHSCVLSFTDSTQAGAVTESPILYGGDCIITRFTFQKRMQFFSQNAANTNYQDGVEYDYRKYRNIGYPRFWIDSTKYDFSELLSGNVVNFTRFSRTTTSKYNLDCKKGDKKNIVRIDDAYMYLSNNAGIDFFVEADYNVDFREKQLNEQPYFSKKNRNITDIFRSDRLQFEEEFNISRAFSDIYTTEIFAPIQRPDFDPDDPVPSDQPNSVIYSLPSFNLQQVDNWQYFLPANYFAFRESDFGTLTGIHKLDQDRVIFLFSKSSPYVSMGRDFLELENSGRKITIGDGGLFAQDPREVMPTDNNYGACNSRYAFSNTHLGRFYPSERQGRILSFTESLDDITRMGMSYWCKNYMPIALYKYFPNYPRTENPVAGVGYLSVFDSFYETCYITKRDFSPKREYINDISYDAENEVFLYKNDIISVRDTRFFNDISWTLSYSPLEKGFVSWHDWHPDWIVQRDNHFLTIKDNGVWKHNESFDTFCKFYGVDYPFEIEFVSNSGQTVEVSRSLEYLLEVYKYKNFGRDRFNVHDTNFDHLIVHNPEQISPLLRLNYMSADPERNLLYPQKDPTTAVTWNVLFSKEENKYRVNQFWDAVKDRGEFSTAESHLFPTDESGYKQVVNPMAIDIDKPEEQRKKFRHYWTKFRLIRGVSGANKFICKLFNIKKVLSTR